MIGRRGFFVLVGAGLTISLGLVLAILASQIGYAGPGTALRALGDPTIRHAVGLSLGTATVAALLSVAVSLPAAYGLGWIYLSGAALGGAYFVAKSIALVRQPGPKAAMVNFKASLLQLGLLQIAAVADRLLLG